MCIHSFLPETAQVVQQNQRFTGNRQMRPVRTYEKAGALDVPAEPQAMAKAPLARRLEPSDLDEFASGAKRRGTKPAPMHHTTERGACP
jgi:hypothetical protein